MMRRLLMGILAAVAVPAELSAQASANTMVAHFIDVGQGSSVLLEFSCGVVLIDAGAQDASDAQKLVAYLRRFFDRRTDLQQTIKTVFITHNHVDHTRALANVAGTFRVGSVVENGARGKKNDPGDAAYVKLAALDNNHRVQPSEVLDEDVAASGNGLTDELIDAVACQGTDPEITLLSSAMKENPGWTATEFKDKNNGSLVVRVDFGRASFLFVGDLEEPAQKTLVDFYADTPLLDTDVYHVGHHGSANGTTWELLNALVRPKMAVISMGDCTRSAGQFNAYAFGHPRVTIVDMLKAAVTDKRAAGKRVPVAVGVKDFRLKNMKAAVYGTGWDGNILISANRDGTYAIQYDRPTAPQSCG